MMGLRLLRRDLLRLLLLLLLLLNLMQIIRTESQQQIRRGIQALQRRGSLS
jgi:hypothetical protein